VSAVARALQRPVEGPLLEVRDLKTHFVTPLGTVRAVDGVSLTLDRGSALGIVGESGSGKTILARSIMGLLPTRNVVREGSVRFAGVELTTMSMKERRRIWGARWRWSSRPDDVAQPVMHRSADLSRRGSTSACRADVDDTADASTPRRHPRAPPPPDGVPPPAVGRHAPTGHHRHRAGLWPGRPVRDEPTGARRHRQAQILDLLAGSSATGTCR
jgi:energy-coupling factor transporter ATP-binding protein EcfA2